MDAETGKGIGSQGAGWDRIRWALEVVALVAGMAAVVSSFPPGASWQAQGCLVIGAALLFLGIMTSIVEAILHVNPRRKPGMESPPRFKGVYILDRPGLPPQDLLGMEFEYARITASEAMNDRHTLVNFYLLLTGVVVSAVAALLSSESPLDPLADALPFVGMALLWALCIIGWLYLLQIIRLRQAWRGSAATMNQIKAFYIANVARFTAGEFKKAFRWQIETLPPAGKLWTINFFSATLIALLNSLVYVGGGLLCAVGLQVSSEAWPWLVPSLAFLGLVLFVFSLYMYVRFLRLEA